MFKGLRVEEGGDKRRKGRLLDDASVLKLGEMWLSLVWCNSTKLKTDIALSCPQPTYFKTLDIPIPPELRCFRYVCFSGCKYRTSGGVCLDA